MMFIRLYLQTSSATKWIDNQTEYTYVITDIVEKFYNSK